MVLSQKNFLNFLTQIKMFRHGNLDETKLKIPSYIAQPLRIGVDFCLFVNFMLAMQTKYRCMQIDQWLDKAIT